MKRKLRRMASFCMTVVLLLSSVVWAPAAGAEGETISLAEADIKFIEVCYYDGSRKKPDMTVTVQGNTLEEKRDYSVSYEDNLDAGTATLTVTGIGKYSGTQTKKFTIHPREISADDLKIEHGYIRAYNESREAFLEIEADSNKVFRQDNVTVVCKRAEFDTPFVGNQKKVTVYEVAFEGEKKGNYALKEETFNLTDNTATITAVEPKLEKSASLAKGQSLDLKQLISNTWKGEVSFSFDIGEESLNCSLTEDGILTAGQETGTVRILANMQPLDVNGDDVPEYTSGIGYLNLKIVEKETQGAFEVIGPERVTYGTSNSFYTVGGSGSGGVTFSIQEEIGTGEADIDPKTGKLTPEKVGTVYVRATKEGDERYQTVESDPVPVTILPAPLTIQVKDKTARIGDAIPTLTAADYTVTGLVGSDTLAQAPSLTYVSTPDMSKTGAVAIQASGAAIPNGNYDPNITYLPGVLTIQEIPTYTVTVPTAENGTITADKATAQEGDTVTLTVRPAEGYVLQSLTATCAAAAPGTVPLQEKGEGIYTFAMPAGDVTVTGTFALEEEEEEPWPPFPFTDVPETMWYYDSVYYVYAHGLMNGTAATLFSPGNPTTRGMLVTILYRMEGSPQGAGWGPFTDVTPGAYYAQPIAWAAWNGIVNGITSTTFAPDRNVTREQMAAILYRYTAWKGWDVSQQGNLFQFTDWQKVQAYARTPLAWAVASGLIQGKENQRLDPGGPATRAEVATILQRFHSTYVAPPAEEETA